MNVLGFFNKGNEFYEFSTESKIDSKFVIEAIDTFTGRVFRPTVLVVMRSAYSMLLFIQLRRL
jgi:hypothetical protein